MTKKKFKPKVGSLVWIISAHRPSVSCIMVNLVVECIEWTVLNSRFQFDLGIYEYKDEAQAAIRAIKKTVREL